MPNPRSIQDRCAEDGVNSKLNFGKSDVPPSDEDTREFDNNPAPVIPAFFKNDLLSLFIVKNHFKPTFELI